MKKVILTDFHNTHRKAIEDIISKTWKYDELCNHKTARLLSKVFLYSCLTNQTFIKVATIENIPVGIIMGKNILKYRCPFQYRVKQIISIIRLMLSKEGRRVSHIFRHVNQVDQKLIDECHQSFQGELAFFVVNEDYRGFGIGQKLFQCLCDYMKKERIHDFYLYTDTSCNYGFYEHQGMKREGQKIATFEIEGHRQEMTFFLYSHHI